MARSLAARLVLAALVWSLLILAAGGVALSRQYRESGLRALDRELQATLDGLIAEAEFDGAGVLSLRQAPNDPRFADPSSGRFWQIAVVSDGRAGAPAVRSDSLWDENLPVESAVAGLRPGAARFSDAPGPLGAPIRLGDQLVRLPGSSDPVLFQAAADRGPALAEAARFDRTLWTSLALLAAGLIAMVVIQVGVGLAPLKTLGRDVAAVRRGQRARLDGAYPTEVAPLTTELNALLDHNRAVVERARTHVGNLAHALKTPISVLLNEARAGEGPFAQLVARQAEAMGRNVDHYLLRAQAAARADMIGARTPLAPVVDDLVRTLERLYGRQKDIDIEVEVPADAVFRGERQDLEEMMGNLLENACKYGRGRVRLTAAPLEGRALRVTVEDDGPGLPPEARAEALKRGVRLDETAPGQGLGLAITADLAALYGGALTLGESDLGGLAATLRLPAAE